MSATCRRAEPIANAATGFSLLEMLVVLVLVAAMAAMVAPRLQATYSALVRSGERAEVTRQLARLPGLARTAGRPIDIAQDDVRAMSQLLALPEGWRVRPMAPLRVAASGVCHEVPVQIEVDGQVETARLSPPACELQLER